MYGRPSRVSGPAGSSSRLPDDTTSVSTPAAANASATASSSARSVGSRPAAHTTARAALACAISASADAGAPAMTARREPARRRSPSSAASDCRSHQRAAAPGAQGRRARGSHTKTGSRREPRRRARSAAAERAGLAARRRSRRNHTSVAVPLGAALGHALSTAAGRLARPRIMREYGRRGAGSTAWPRAHLTRCPRHRRVRRRSHCRRGARTRRRTRRGGRCGRRHVA